MADRLTVVGFATAVVAGLGALGVLVLHFAGTLGSFLAGLETVIGVGLFIVIWGLAVASHSRAFADVDPLTVRTPRQAGRGLLVGASWGGIAGVGFFLVVFGALLLAVVITDPTAILDLVALPTLFILGIGTVFGVAIGGLIGIIAAGCEILVGMVVQWLGGDLHGGGDTGAEPPEAGGNGGGE